jgi:hypothetical protein
MFPGRTDVVRKALAVLSVTSLLAVCLSASAEAGFGGRCGRTRHCLLGECVSALIAHPSHPNAVRMASFSPARSTQIDHGA